MPKSLASFFNLFVFGVLNIGDKPKMFVVVFHRRMRLKQATDYVVCRSALELLYLRL